LSGVRLFDISVFALLVGDVLVAMLNPFDVEVILICLCFRS